MKFNKTSFFLLLAFFCCDISLSTYAAIPKPKKTGKRTCNGKQKESGDRKRKDTQEESEQPGKHLRATPADADNICIFAHGLGGTADQREYYARFFGCPITGANGPEWDAQLYGDHVGPKQSCLAQDGDIDVVVHQIEGHGHDRILLLGISKGAATMLTTVGWLAAHNPDLLQPIGAVILDSPFATVTNVAANLAKQYVGEFAGECVGFCSGSLIRPLAFPNYDPDGINPLKAITQQWEHVDRNMVVVFIGSKEDHLISIKDSRRLYCELKKMAFENVYLIETEHGEHANVCCEANQAQITMALRLICDLHDLPLPPGSENYINEQTDEDLARVLATIQPSVDEVQQRINPDQGSCSSWL